MPSKSKGREPNARLDPDMQYFNMAIHMLADMAEHADDWIAFQHFYLKPERLVKQTVAELGIGTRTYYDRVKRFGTRAKALAPVIKRVHETNTRAMATSAAAALAADED
jgi:transposase